jgi:hypothetical protein
MHADREAPVFEKGEAVIEAPPEVVWDTLTDFRSWPSWMPGVRTVEIGETVGVGTRFKWKAGPGTINSQVIEWEPPRAVGWKGHSLGIEALHAWRIDGGGQESRVVTEESWSGLLARLLRGPMQKTVRKALDDGLSALKVEAEQRAQP